jgi:ATP-dependent Clp protease ATP-binding subunit ClpC
MFERFTDRSRKAMYLAAEVARERGAPSVDVIHILHGLASEHEGIAGQVLSEFAARDIEEVGGDTTYSPEGLERRMGPKAPPKSGHIPYSHEAKRVVGLSLREALRCGHSYIGTEHILLAALKEETAGDLGYEIPEMRSAVFEKLGYPVIQMFSPPAEQQSETVQSLLKDAQERVFGLSEVLGRILETMEE